MGLLVAQVTVRPMRAEPIGLEPMAVYVTWSGSWMSRVLLWTWRPDLLEIVYATFNIFPGIGACRVIVVYGRRRKVSNQPGVWYSHPHDVRMHGAYPRDVYPLFTALASGLALKSRRMLAGQLVWALAPLARKPKARSARWVNMACLVVCSNEQA